MEEGSLRCDANVSIRPRGQREFGTKTEVKNVNSFRFIRQALEYEIERHEQVIESGGRIEQETRLYNAAEGKTYGMRSKEQAHDYRYFPEPDLLPLIVDEKWREEIVSQLPELPEARRARMVVAIRHHGIRRDDAHQYPSACRPIRRGRGAAKNPKRVANLVQSELLGRLKAKGLEIEQSPISMKGVAMSADLVESGAISGKDAERSLRSRLRARRRLSRDLRKGEAAADHRHFARSRRSSMRLSPPIPNSSSSIAVARKL